MRNFSLKYILSREHSLFSTNEFSNSLVFRCFHILESTVTRGVLLINLFVEMELVEGG